MQRLHYIACNVQLLNKHAYSIYLILLYTHSIYTNTITVHHIYHSGMTKYTSIHISYTPSYTGKLMMLPSDLVLIEDPGFKQYVDIYAKDQKKFFSDFSSAFQRLEGKYNIV